MRGIRLPRGPRGDGCVGSEGERVEMEENGKG